MASEPTVAEPLNSRSEPECSSLAPRAGETASSTKAVSSGGAIDSRSESITFRFKYRLRFAKAGDLRLVSHHDLMHCCERLFRRANLPIAATQGFHPTPRVVFSLSLPLGVAGLNEVMELELTRDIEPEVLLQTLRDHAPPGMIFHAIQRIQKKTTGQVRRTFYRIALNGTDADSIAQRCRDLLSQPHVWMARYKPYARQVDIRPFIETITPRDQVLSFTLWMTPFGTARPDEILRLLNLEQLLEEGSVLERYDLELADEGGPDAPPVPSVDPKTIIAPLEDKHTRPRQADDEEAPRPHSLIEGPLSFET